MSFESNVSTLDNARLVTLHGRLDSVTSSILEKSLLGLFDGPDRHVIVDFSALDYVSSAGLRIILMAAKKAKQVQSRLVLFGLVPHIHEVFEISGFLKILDITSDQAAALARLT